MSLDIMGAIVYSSSSSPWSDGMEVTMNINMEEKKGKTVGHNVIMCLHLCLSLNVHFFHSCCKSQLNSSFRETTCQRSSASVYWARRPNKDSLIINGLLMTLAIKSHIYIARVTFVKRKLTRFKGISYKQLAKYIWMKAAQRSNSTPCQIYHVPK